MQPDVIKTGACCASTIGDYKCSVQTKRGFCCDICLEKEIDDLWDNGVRTVGSCCGHGVAPPFIQVLDDESVQKMHELGYVQLPVDKHGNGKNCFSPKSI